MLRLHVALFAVVLLAAACNLSPGTTQSQAAETATPMGTWINLLAPPAGTAVERGATIELSAVVENAGENLERAEVRIDGEIVRRYLMPSADDTSSVAISENWLAEALGEHVLKFYVCFTDGSCIESAPVMIQVVAPPTEPVPITSNPTKVTVAATVVTPAFTTVTPEPTAPANVVTARILTEVLNVRSGPSTQFELVSTLKKDDTVRVFARTESGWYKIFLSGQERWLYGAADAGLVELIGPHETLPIDHGPPLPTQPPATATPIPPQYPNLIIEGAELQGGNLVCGESGILRFRVRNAGNVPTQWGGSIRVRDILTRNLEGKDFQAPNFGILAADERTPWFVVNLLVDTYYGEKHTLEIMVDSQKQITESNELDNRWEYAYVLQQGECP